MVECCKGVFMIQSALQKTLGAWFTIALALNAVAEMPPQMKYKVILGDEGNSKVHYIDLANPTDKWTASVFHRDMQFVGNDRVMVSTGDGYAEYSTLTGTLQKKVTAGGTVQSVFRLTGKSTFVGVDGNPASVKEVDTSGKTLRTITLSTNANIRVIRPTMKKTYLVGGKAAGTMYECDSTGKVIWQANAGGEPYMALRLPNGNTLISSGYGAQMVLAGPSGAVIKKFPDQSDKTGNDFWTQAKPNFFAGFQILKNGNIVVSNWQGHGGGNGNSGFQLLEFDSTLSKVISYWKQDPSLVSSLHAVLVIDNIDTKLMYSDANGIMAPIINDIITPVRQAYGNEAAGGLLSAHQYPAIPGKASGLFDCTGRSVTSVAAHHRPAGIFILKNGRMNVSAGQGRIE